MEQLIQFMEQMIQIPQFVCGTQFCSLHAVDVCARECFKKVSYIPCIMYSTLFSRH